MASTNLTNMKNRSIIILSLLITFLVSLIPIPQQTFIGRGPTYEYLPTYGFPITIAKIDVFSSPTNTIHWYPVDIAAYTILFIANFLIYTVVIKVITIIYSKSKKLTPPDSA